MLMSPENIMAVGQRNDRINDKLFGLVIRRHGCMSIFLMSNISNLEDKELSEK